MPGSTAQTNKFHTFYLQQRPDNGDTWADIKVNHPLDYESIKEYNLTIRVEVSVKQSVNYFASFDSIFQFKVVGKEREAFSPGKVALKLSLSELN